MIRAAFENDPALATIAALLGVWALALAADWLLGRFVPVLDADDTRGLSDTERTELDILHGEPGRWE